MRMVYSKDALQGHFDLGRCQSSPKPADTARTSRQHQQQQQTMHKPPFNHEKGRSEQNSVTTSEWKRQRWISIIRCNHRVKKEDLEHSKKACTEFKSQKCDWFTDTTQQINFLY